MNDIEIIFKLILSSNDSLEEFYKSEIDKNLVDQEKVDTLKKERIELLSQLSEQSLTQLNEALNSFDISIRSKISVKNLDLLFVFYTMLDRVRDQKSK